ncbi:hypothetical protein Nepgr_033802 [Nepenthes gracilis]|uniref:Uncharacterized protein n=1 Tax=Nepenthes gracilis TaxID=150966 RepID=A0AAD3TMY8_NEPGR|nr:hypothetical protein Nepgr_033802 [Nepenthes gracilis]
MIEGRAFEFQSMDMLLQMMYLYLEQHIVKGETVEQLWRVLMGLSDYDLKKALELWLQNDSEDNLGSNIVEAKLAFVKSKSKKEVSRSNSHKGPGLQKVLCAMMTGMKTGSKKIHMLLLLFCVLPYQLVLPTVATNS